MKQLTYTPTLDISVGEWCWLERRRAGRTAGWWANTHGFSVDELRLRETDQRDIALTYAQVLAACATPISAGEYCALARRRAGLGMTDVAARYGVSRMTLWKMEHDLTETSVALARWWHRKGMSLPTLNATTITVALAPGIYG